MVVGAVMGGGRAHSLGGGVCSSYASSVFGGYLPWRVVCRFRLRGVVGGHLGLASSGRVARVVDGCLTGGVWEQAIGGSWCFQALLCSGFLRFSSVSWVA